MQATYNSETKKFRLIYFDAVKAAKGDKYPYSRKQETWKGDKNPSKREIACVKARLLNEGKLLEQAAQLEADKIKNEFPILTDNGEIKFSDDTEQVNALLYFTNLKPQDISEAENKKSIRRVERIIESFCDFLKKNYPLMPLNKIGKEIIGEFFETISHLAEEHQRHYFCYLSLIWKKIIDDFEESNIKYTNPLLKEGRDKLIKKKVKREKMAFTIDQMKQILNYLVDDEKNNNIHGQQKFAIFYFLIVTGWRISDILSLTWEQINLEQRTISLTHSKTKKKSGHETIIFITPLMKRILENQKKNTEQQPKNKNLVFCIRPHLEEINAPATYIYAINRILFPALEEMKMLKTTPNNTGMNMKNYTVHCFRKSTITELDLCEKFSPNKITYLVGHANKDIEAKYYLKLKMYPERSTRKMIEHMEQITELEFWYNKLLEGSQKAVKTIAEQNKELTATEIDALKMNFWTDEAIDRLKELQKNGMNKVLIDIVIYTCNKTRLESDSENVKPEHVADVLQMLQWVNIDKSVNNLLTK